MINCKDKYLDKRRMVTYLKTLKKKEDIVDFSVEDNYIKIDTKDSNWYGDYFWLFYKNDVFIGFIYDDELNYHNREDFDKLTDILVFETKMDSKSRWISYEALYQDFKILFND